jgi:hypothetical protein
MLQRRKLSQSVFRSGTFRSAPRVLGLSDLDDAHSIEFVLSEGISEPLSAPSSAQVRSTRRHEALHRALACLRFQRALLGRVGNRDDAHRCRLGRGGQRA